MTNLADEFERVAVGPILAAVVGDDDRKRWSERDKDPLRGKVLSWAEARPILDYEYDNGFGGAECHAVYAWTETQVLLIHEYDGATDVGWLPRHPTPCEPQFG